MVALCVLTGRAWQTSGPPTPDPARLRAWAAVSLILVFAQIAVGASFRHFKSSTALWSHITLAVVVLGVTHVVAARVRRRRGQAGLLLPSARALVVATTIQVALGLLALWLMLPLGGNPRTPTLWQAMTRTAHQTNGALLLAASVVLALRAFGHLRPSSDSRPPLQNQNRTEPHPQTLEAVA